MRFLLLITLIASFSSVADVLKSSQDKIGLYKTGDPPELHYWTVDSKGKLLKVIAKHEPGMKVYKKGGTFELVRRTKKEIQKDATPFPNAKPKMTENACGQVDIADKMGPVKKQTGGTCYGYAAMELLNFGTQEKYSALHLIQMMSGMPPEEKLREDRDNPLRLVRGFSGSSIETAVELGMKTGLCPESVVPDTRGGVLENNYKDLLSYYKKIAAKKVDLQKDCTEDMADEKDIIEKMKILLRSKMKQDKLWDTEDVEDALKEIFPQIEHSYVRQLWIESDDATQFMMAMAKEACKDSLKKGVPPGKSLSNVHSDENYFTRDEKKYYYEEDRASLIDNINNSLNKGRPIGISYITGGLIKAVGEKTHGMHASTVSGRKWLSEEKDKDGKVTQAAGCYYLVKNSWGEDWKVPEGMKAKSSALHPGFFVVSEKQLLEHMYGTTWID